MKTIIKIFNRLLVAWKTAFELHCFEEFIELKYKSLFNMKLKNR